MIDEFKQSFARARETSRREMKIVNEEDYGPTANYGRWTGNRSRGRIGRRGSLFALTSGSHALKERDRLRLVIDLQGKLIRFQSVDEVAFLIKDHYVGLHQFSVDTNDIGLFTCLAGLGLRADRYCQS